MTVKYNFNYITSLSGRPLNVDSIDAGRRVSLTDVAGPPRREWNEPGTMRRYEYDTPLHRPIAVYETLDGEECTVERMTYGVASDSDMNLNGKLTRHYDNAGLREINSIGLTGQVLSEKRQLLQNVEGDAH